MTKDYLIFKSAVKRTLKNKINHKKKKRIVSELKGADTTFEIKKYFYGLIKEDKNWFLHTIILDKKSLTRNNQLINDKETLYNILSSTVLDVKRP